MEQSRTTVPVIWANTCVCEFNRFACSALWNNSFKYLRCTDSFSFVLSTIFTRVNVLPDMWEPILSTGSGSLASGVGQFVVIAVDQRKALVISADRRQRRMLVESMLQATQVPSVCKALRPDLGPLGCLSSLTWLLASRAAVVQIRVPGSAAYPAGRSGVQLSTTSRGSFRPTTCTISPISVSWPAGAEQCCQTRGHQLTASSFSRPLWAPSWKAHSCRCCPTEDTQTHLRSPRWAARRGSARSLVLFLVSASRGFIRNGNWVLGHVIRDSGGIRSWQIRGRFVYCYHCGMKS